MKKKIKLDNNWFLKYCEYGSGKRFGIHEEKKYSGWLPARVPGDAHLDLMEAGIISDPFYGVDSDKCTWMEEKDWWYRTTFSIPDSLKLQDSQHLFLQFHGLDTFATIFLNGKEIGAHSNMFVPLRLDIRNLLIPGINDLRVCLASPAFTPDIHGDPGIARTPPQRLWSRKAQACYGWDIAPRLVTIGIWRPVEIVLCDAVEIQDPWVRTTCLNGTDADVELEFRAVSHNNKKHRVTVEIEMSDVTRSFDLDIDTVSTVHREKISLKDAPLWWPHNHGLPNLIPYSITILEGSKKIDCYQGKFGIRTIDLIQEPQEGGTSSFYFEINGKPVFLKGMNWTPSDAIYARISCERTKQLIDKAAESNINALRVWGGGIYESDSFYDYCDEKGILVWQDFMFACGVYPQKESFFAEVRKEAEYIIPHLRGHPSIFLWCGDNEVDWVYLQEQLPDFKNNRINRDVLPDVCSTLDVSRPYIPSSPFSCDDEHPNDSKSGNVHLWKHGSSYKDPFYAKCFPNMVTEIGHISLPDLDVIKSFIPEDKLWPPVDAHWYLHCSDPLRSGDSYRVATWFTSIAENGMEKPNDLKALIRMTQQLQTDATTFWIEHFSSQPGCWGLFLWNLCDCWPQISDAYIAYPYSEKPALDAVKTGYGKIDR